MNIFFLSMVPQRAAQWHCDKHVVKMILESVQLLWTAQHVLRKEPLTPCSIPLTPYKATHRSHPCAIWTRASAANYRWLCALTAELVLEYHYRWPLSRAHACEPHLRWLTDNEPPGLPEGSLTWPARAMPPEYKISENPTACYRAYYEGAKRHIYKWTTRDPPSWTTESKNR